MKRTGASLGCCLWLSLCSYAMAAETSGEPGAGTQTETMQTQPENTAEQGLDEEVWEREQNAQEDPVAKRRDERVHETRKWLEEPDGIKLYGVLHLHYRQTQTHDFLGDSDTKAGMDGQWQYTPSQRLFAGVEAGINILNQLDLRIDRGSQRTSSGTGNNVILRLAYLGIETPDVLLIAGKNWSTYYQVASFTDRFAVAGGEASGVYSAGTDGGPVGTGRADRVLQSRLLIEFPERTGIKPFHLNVQLQHGEPIPNTAHARYGTGFGLSMIYETSENVSIGLAYNRAYVPKSDPAVRNAGIRGDAEAGLAGIRWFNQNWYLGTIVSRLKNIMTTDQNIYFDGWGWEVYSQYQIIPRWWVTAGWNVLTPDGGQPRAGHYRLRYAVAGIRYALKDFARYLYFNAQLDRGKNAGGIRDGNIYTLGIKWGF